MSKSKVSVSKKQLTATGEELEMVGAMAEVDGALKVADGAENLEVAQVAGRIAVSQVAAGSSDLTRAADAAIVAERVQELSEIVGAAGVVDVEEGVDMMLKGGDVKAMGAIVKLMSREELDRGLELARIAGELGTVSDVAGLLDMPVIAEFLEERGSRLQEIAVDQLLRYTGTRALAGAIKEAGEHIEAMGEDEVVDGVVGPGGVLDGGNGRAFGRNEGPMFLVDGVLVDPFFKERDFTLGNDLVGCRGRHDFLGVLVAHPLDDLGGGPLAFEDHGLAVFHGFEGKLGAVQAEIRLAGAGVGAVTEVTIFG